jgi:glycosyltransferase involved in cell wall biosynthesis
VKKVLIGTPSYDGKVDTWFADSLVRTLRQGWNQKIEIHTIYPSYDSLVQRARNDLVRMAMDGGYDTLFFIDADVEWEPEWFFRLLARPEPVVGAALVKKSDREGYTVKITHKKIIRSEDESLIEVDGLGTGFLKVDRFAFEKLWLMSEPYLHEGVPNRMVFDVKIIDGDLVSEDFILCRKWLSLGYKVWCDPSITINHNGVKKYIGDLAAFLTKNDYF